MPKQIKKTLMIMAGIILIILGLIGLALPFLQGFLFLAIGIVLLSLASSRIRGWTEMHTRRFPKVHKFIEKTQGWVVRIIGPVE